jgi:hypothetical protein
MTPVSLDHIRAALRGKTVFLTPYCHADHAWEHTRDCRVCVDLAPWQIVSLRASGRNTG